MVGKDIDTNAQTVESNAGFAFGIDDSPAGVTLASDGDDIAPSAQCWLVYAPDGSSVDDAMGGDFRTREDCEATCISAHAAVVPDDPCALRYCMWNDERIDGD
jgi:hypothetical protein